MQHAVTRDEWANSLRILDEYCWIYLSKLAGLTRRNLGQQGLEAVYEGIWNCGYARGQSIRESAQVCAEGRDVLSLFRAWDAADLLLASSGDRLDIAGSPSEAALKLLRIPGSEYAPIHDEQGFLAGYWENTLKGMCAGFDENLSIDWTPMSDGSKTGWEMTVRYRGDAADRAGELPDDPLDDPAAAIALSRSSVSAFALLCMHTGQALFDRFDATGEKTVRDALYDFGLERARGMRDDVLAEGKPLNFETWFEAIQKRDPNSSAFVFRGDIRVSPGVFQVSCTYCPCADAWSEDGTRGLHFGRIYDLEVHRGLVEGFHPGGIVAWEKLKTRGDKVCNFRFYIPDLVSDDDPEWAKAKRDTL